MAIILISQGFRGVDFLRKPSVYLHFKAFAGPTKYGLAIVLMFIGTKMLIVDFVKIPVLLSLGVVAGIIATSVALSLRRGNAPVSGPEPEKEMS